MELLLYFFIFSLGTIIGSFLNVVIDRIPRGESIMSGRSHCEYCRHILQWYELIPIVSHIYLRGRCSHCKKKIGNYYSIVEAVTGIIFVFVIFTILGGKLFLLVDLRYLITILYFLYIVSNLIVIFFIDLKYGIIPFSLVFSAVFVTLLWYVILPGFHFSSQDMGMIVPKQNYFISAVLSGFCTFAFFLFLFLITKGRGLGFGDVVYVFFMGFVLGFPKVLLALYIAFLSGAIGSIILIVMGKKKMRGGTIPFGPFLTMGTFISVIWGQMLVDKIYAFLLLH